MIFTLSRVGQLGEGGGVEALYDMFIRTYMQYPGAFCCIMLLYTRPISKMIFTLSRVGQLGEGGGVEAFLSALYGVITSAVAVFEVPTHAQ